MTHAADQSNVGRSQSLTQRGADITKRDKGGRTAAHHAAMRGDKEALLALLDARCEIDAADSSNMTPLMYAAREGHVECVRLLVQLLYALACGCRLEVPRRLDVVPITFPFCSVPL